MALTFPIGVEPSTIPETMRAAVLYGPRDIRVIDRPVPQPGPGEVLVQVAMCGTCGTDLKSTTGIFRSPCRMAPLHLGTSGRGPLSPWVKPWMSSS